VDVDVVVDPVEPDAGAGVDVDVDEVVVPDAGAGMDVDGVEGDGAYIERMSPTRELAGSEAKAPEPPFHALLRLL
jgi:hypothetical protein